MLSIVSLCFIMMFCEDPVSIILPSLSIDDGISHEKGGTLTFMVRLSKKSTRDVSVDYSTIDGTAFTPGDYVSSYGTLIIPAGSISGIIAIDIIDDLVCELDEVLMVNLNNAINATISDYQGEGNIIDNDGVPSLFINDVTVGEGNSGTEKAVFTVRLSLASSQIVSVDYSTIDSTAASPADYTSTSGTLSIPAGSSSGTISVSINNDLLVETNEIFTVDLSNPVNSIIADSQGLGTIINDYPESSGNLIFEETFEGYDPFSTAHSFDIGDWDYALQYVSFPVFQGTYCARFEIREDQPLVADGKRAEVVIIKGSEGDISKNTWYSFAVYFPSDGYEFDDQREAINQWYQNGSPATSLRTEEDRIILETGNEPNNTKEEIDIGDITKDEWHTFVFHFIHSYDSDGLIEVWHNGNKIITHTGGNMYDDVLPKWKIGLYKSSFKSGTSDVDKRVIFFDNIRVGNEKATFDEMKPFQ